MPVILEIVDNKKLFESLRHPPVILNDLKCNTEIERQAVQEMLFLRFQGTDTVSIVPSCRCGATKSEDLIGECCHICGTKVESVFDESVEPQVWFRSPKGCAPLINLSVLNLLRARFKVSGFNVIQWLIDRQYRPTAKKPLIMAKIEAEIPRGYNEFYENFDRIISYLFSLRAFKTKNPTGRDDLQTLLDMLKKQGVNIFSDHIPVPNKSVFVIEGTNVGVYGDMNVVMAMDAIQSMVSIDTDFYDQRTVVKMNRAIKAIIQMTDFFQNYLKYAGKKPGEFRKHIYATRASYTFRTVITPLTGIHHYREMRPSWGATVGVFRQDLLNHLFKMGYCYNDALAKINAAIYKCDKVIEGILEGIFEEGRMRGGLTMVAQRNPSLLQGSIQDNNALDFKRDPEDTTSAVSILNCVLWNADFDGDELNFERPLDNQTSDSLYPLQPHFSVLDMNKPLGVSDAIALPKPVVETLSLFLQPV